MKATGEIHPGFIGASATADENVIFIHGGAVTNSKYTNDLSTLSREGVFSKLEPSEEIPSPRRDHCSWTFASNHYFFAGQLGDDSFSNDLIQYNRKKNEFRRVASTGHVPTARSRCATAKLHKMVYLHAGHCEGQNLNDFMAINMITMQWTKFTDSGFTDGVCDHTITRVSEKHILLIGGNLGSTVSDRVLLFDVEDRAWTEQDSLSLRSFPRTTAFSSFASAEMSTLPKKHIPNTCPFSSFVREF